MERDNAFNLDEQVNNWAEILKTKPSLTESDVEEMKSHFYDSYESLLEKGLNEKETFLLTRLRMGEGFELDEAYKQANQPVLQMRRSVYILAGVLIYFLAYHFIMAFSNLLIVVLMEIDGNGYKALEWNSRHLISWHFLFLAFLAFIYFFEKKTLVFFGKMKLEPIHTIFLLILTVFFAVANRFLRPLALDLLTYELWMRGKLIHNYIYFGFSFPFLLGMGFILIYFKYHKKTAI